MVIGIWINFQNLRLCNEVIPLILFYCWQHLAKYRPMFTLKNNIQGVALSPITARLLIVKQHHHHHVVPPARISLTLCRHFSLLFIAFSELHHVSSHSCCMYVRAGRPAFAWPYVGVHRSTSLMSSSLLLQQCPVCLVRLLCIVFVMGGNIV